MFQRTVRVDPLNVKQGVLDSGQRVDIPNSVPTPPLLSVDFSSLALGKMSAAAFLAATGLTFTRSTISTVQTSTSTIDASPAVDDACIGNAGYGRGLVIQHNTKNGLLTAASSRSILVSDGWANSGSPAGQSAGFADSPATPQGVGCSRVSILATQFSNYGDVPSALRIAFSSWQRSRDAAGGIGNMQQVWVTAAPGDGIQVDRAASNTWARLALFNGTVTREYFAVVDSRNYTGSGGEAAVDRDILVDFIQYERGDFVTEAIAAGNARRACDCLSRTPGSSIVTPLGQISFHATFVPKFASTMQLFYDGAGGQGTAANWNFFGWGATDTNYARIKDSDKKLYVKFAGGAEVVSHQPIVLTQFDTIDVWVIVGSGLASTAVYRITTAGVPGPLVDMQLDPVTGVPAPGGGAVTILGSGDATQLTIDSGQIPCWFTKVVFDTDGAVPV